ncbi:RNA polymerase sigma-70 factor [Aliifodinibius sp. S!AR15-10]|uniref:RNA polymerase sigma-70 factor n=1 Tax=Aliifodinibius sp. S!AR15-10 TaxID=2950437 RepID=UPI00285DA47E|nr:RNA polymerase sigma-70 factor [Aliifodinibius sp. S!AR15-10]MDR8391920.1 RNA polymerase sigma-70 factor [Aliifodinibius sp. S!AR15-10]
MSYTEKSDSELLLHLTKEDQEALEALFERYYYRLCDFAFQYVRNFDLCEEVVSDVFLKIWKRRKKMYRVQSFKSYLYTATRNQALNYVDKKDAETTFMDDIQTEVRSKKYHPDEELIFKEFENRMEALINTLPPRRKVIFKLSRLEGFTYKEIAEILSISVRTVQNQMVEAVKQLGSYATANK